MLFVIPWILLIVISIIAIPIAAKMSPSSAKPAPFENAEVDLDSEEPMDVGDDFAAEPFGDPGEAVEDDAFADFK